MGSGASISSSVYSFNSKTESDNLKSKNSNANEHSQKWIFNASNQQKHRTNFKELGSNLVRNLLRSEFDLPLNLQTPELTPTVDKEADRKEPKPALKKNDNEMGPLVLLPSRSSQYFKNLILMTEPDPIKHEPDLDPSGDVNRVIKTFSISSDKLSKLKFFSK